MTRQPKRTTKELNDVNVFVRMPHALRDRLRRIAVEHHMSEAEVVRDALRYYVPVTRKAEVTR